MKTSIHHARSAAALFVVACTVVACERQAPSSDEAPAVRSYLAASPAQPPPADGRTCRDYRECSGWQYPDPNLNCCDGLCADTASDPRNCGSCGAVCAPGLTCKGGKCQPPGPPPKARGATPAAAAYTIVGKDCASTACAGGQICCGGVCVAPWWDSNNCGGCNVVCNGNTACKIGVCCQAETPSASCHNATCPQGWVNCGAACKDLGADPDNCGACGAACPANARNCVAGTCQH